VVDKAQYDNIHRYITAGKEQATLITGGYHFDKEGFYVPPTIFADPQPGALIYHEEIFGPVGCVKVFEDEDEVIKAANDSHYGLAGKCHTATSASFLKLTV